MLCDAMWEHYNKVILVGWENVLKGEFLMDQIISIIIVTNTLLDIIFE